MVRTIAAGFRVSARTARKWASAFEGKGFAVCGTARRVRANALCALRRMWNNAWNSYAVGVLPAHRLQGNFSLRRGPSFFGLRI
jgi:hypothetical protein